MISNDETSLSDMIDKISRKHATSDDDAWQTQCTMSTQSSHPPWLGASTTSKSWDVNKHLAQCTSTMHCGLAVLTDV